MIQIQQRGPGDFIARVETACINRTGATLLRGQVAMMDILDTQAEVTAGDVTPGAETSIMANVTPVTQASLEEGFPILIALDPIADNATGRFLVCGIDQVAVLDDDVSTTDIDKGDRISMVIAESAVAVQAFITGGVGSRALGIAIEDAAATSADTDRLIDASTHLRKCIWTGGIPILGSTDT